MNVATDEINKFSAHARRWWDPAGPVATLHQINPLRMEFIQQKSPLTDQCVLDIGCGGGILSEAMAKAGASVTGIDASQELIQVAQLHSQVNHLQVTYHHSTIENFSIDTPCFDLVVCMELLEHVPEPQSLLQQAIQRLKPGGSLIISTINRTAKAYLHAIVGAEFILKLLPINTHQYAKFIRPSEIAAWVRKEGCELAQSAGIGYNPFSRQFKLQPDIQVNYLLRVLKTHA